MESQPKRADVMSINPGTKAPWFSRIGFQEKFMDINLNDYTGKWLVLFFYPLDFGSFCSPTLVPSKLLELVVRRPELESLNCR